MRDHHYIENKWVDVKSAVPIEQMREVLLQQRAKASHLRELNELPIPSFKVGGV